MTSQEQSEQSPLKTAGAEVEAEAEAEAEATSKGKANDSPFVLACQNLDRLIVASWHSRIIWGVFYVSLS